MPGFSYGNVLAEIRALLAAPDLDLTAIDYRKFIPTFGTMRLAGLAMEVPQQAPKAPSGPGGAAGQALAATQTMKIGIGAFELKALDPVNGIPTTISLTIDNLRSPVVETPGTPAMKDLIAMGYRDLDLSAKLDLAWLAASNEIAIKTLSLGGAGMAKFEASGTLGNVTKDLFASDVALAQVAALGATARSVQAKLQNFGLLEKIVENEARKGRRKPEDLRREFSMMASLGLAAILGPSDGAKALAGAVARFAAKPGTLTVSATAKSPSGLGLADVITLTDPTEIFDKIDVKANAE